ncbi:MAG: AzlC family ABC transporter permease [Actinobacteria bacterium]|nr:AzlC family ABC transporter permease [Actinomycetota bacterium]
MSTTRDAFRQGVVDVLPVVLGVVPFGLIAGVAAADAGFDLVTALGFSVGIFAGASQLAAIDLLGRDAPALVAIGTIAVINSRMLMYGASLAPYLAREPLHRRLGAAYFLVDQVYALCLIRWRADPELPRLPYYLGTAIPLWVNWVLWTAVGAVAGASLPSAIPLGFAVPLVFLALLVPAMHDRPTVAAGVAAATVATVAAPLPANLGMPLAAVTGIAVGLGVSVLGGGVREAEAAGDAVEAT